MKSVVRILSIAVVCALALGACKKDKMDYAGADNNGIENVGYLSFAEMEASVLVETENVANDTQTRADGVNIDNFDVVVTNVAGEQMASFKYSERPTEPIRLDAGTYTITMTSMAMIGAAWETPIYAGTKEVIIKRQEKTEVKDIVCKLANIKVTVAYSADLFEQLNDANTKMTVAVGDNSEDFSCGESRGCYFAPTGEESTLKLTFSCRYKDSDKDIVMTNEIKGVKAAQWRKINVVVQHAADGTSTIGIVCDTWTYDEEVVFDTATFLMQTEEIIPDDTDVPVINWESHDLTQPFELTDDMFDENGNFTSSINVDVTAKSPLKSLVVKAQSDNADFIAAYTAFVAEEEDLCNTTTNAALLKSMGYPTDVKGATTVRLQFAKQAANLLKEYEGTHSYEITATDETGAHATATLTVKYGQNVAPHIVWVGYDIDKRQTYNADLTCDLKVTAPLTIADFNVEIVSETLNADQLAGVGLASKFSLVKDTQYFGVLGGQPYEGAETEDGLGFPVGDEVYGKTEVDLSISNFLSVLGMLGAGEHDFVMSVTDAEGNTTTKTVMLKFE